MVGKFLKTSILFLIVFVCCVNAQDFQPDPLEPSTTTSTTISSAELATSTKQIATDVGPTIAPDIATATTSSSTTGSTSMAQQPSSTALGTSSENQIPNFPSSTIFPQYPETPTQKCYFRRQQGMLQHFWTCEGLQWSYNMECYYCCISENSLFAGCNKIDYSYCEYQY